MPKNLCKGIHSKTLDTAEQNCKKKKNSNDNQEGRQKKKSQKSQKLKKQRKQTANKK